MIVPDRQPVCPGRVEKLSKKGKLRVRRRKQKSDSTEVDYNEKYSRKVCLNSGRFYRMKQGMSEIRKYN